MADLYYHPDGAQQPYNLSEASRSAHTPEMCAALVTDLTALLLSGYVEGKEFKISERSTPHDPPYEVQIQALQAEVAEIREVYGRLTGIDLPPVM
jgi:hypothetical protein